MRIDARAARARSGTAGGSRARIGVRCLRDQLLEMLVVLALGVGLSGPANADDYRIGVLHVERILQQSAPAKAALERIEQEFKGRDTDLSRQEQAVRDEAAQLEKVRSTLSADERASRERALDTKTRDVQRQRQQFAEDLRGRQFQELDKLKERLDAVLTRYAKERNYDLILQDALWVGKSVDITDDIIKALSAQQ